ncbi:hypothetical protein [Saccharothrix sp. ALI-22-I]|uniref:hypothetical protein n=1 Tax=Saccharothrix sp. ALI-22-I TaxID=1933778 RepID=UPI00117ADCA8|nr:hypothetical protein [Saccharothrix sp. ALI-22-I]
MEYRHARATLNALLADNLVELELLEEASQAVRDLAPSKPTDWWPGAWLGEQTDLPPGVTPMWRKVCRTEWEAHQERPEHLAPEQWTVEWEPTIPCLLGTDKVFIFGDDLLDAQFWQDVDATGRVDWVPSSKPFVPTTSVSDVVDTAAWIGTAAVSGMIGNAAYDGIKATVKGIRDRRPHGRDGTQDTAASPVSSTDDPECNTPTPARLAPDRAQRRLDIDIPDGAPPIIGQDVIDP